MERRVLTFFILGLVITGIPLGIQILLLNEQVSELVYEIDLKNKEISEMNAELENRLNNFISKCDIILISEVYNSLEEIINKFFTLTIEFSGEISEDDVRELNSIGIGFVSLDNSLVHKRGKYLASGSKKAIYQAVKRDDVTRIEYGFSGEIIDFTAGAYQEDAFANISKYADVTVTPITASLGNWIEITIKNSHPTKKLAFTLIIYYEIEDGSQAEVFSTAISSPQGMLDYPPYIFLNPGSEYIMQFRPEVTGKYFITPNHVEFTILIE